MKTRTESWNSINKKRRTSYNSLISVCGQSKVMVSNKFWPLQPPVRVTCWGGALLFTHTHKRTDTEGREFWRSDSLKHRSPQEEYKIQLSAESRADQHPDDFYESGEQVFCKSCRLTIDWTHKNTFDDHLQSESDIPLEKNKKLPQFLVKHCKGGGALPEHESSPHQIHSPRVFEQNMESVRQKLQGKKILLRRWRNYRCKTVVKIITGEWIKKNAFTPVN